MIICIKNKEKKIVPKLERTLILFYQFSKEMVFLFDLNLLTQSIDIFLINLQVKAGAIYQSKHVTESNTLMG